MYKTSTMFDHMAPGNQPRVASTSRITPTPREETNENASPGARRFIEKVGDMLVREKKKKKMFLFWVFN